jgi:hypothetical protein
VASIRFEKTGFSLVELTSHAAGDIGNQAFGRGFSADDIPDIDRIMRQIDGQTPDQLSSLFGGTSPDGLAANQWSPISSADGHKVSWQMVHHHQWSVESTMINGDASNDAMPSVLVNKNNYEPPAQQLSLSLSQLQLEGQQHIRVQLRPVELGHVEVNLHVDKDGATSVSILAERPETLDMLRKDSSILEQALSGVGASSDNGSLQFGLWQGQSQQQSPQDQNQRYGYGSLDELDEMSEEDRIASLVQKLHFIGNDGLEHVDMRI